MKTSLSLVLSIGLASVLASSACGEESQGTCEEALLCGGDAGNDGTNSSGDGGDAGVITPPGCDLAADAKDAPKCVDDAVGVFVDATSGIDTNSGTKASPVKTLGAALGKLGAKPRIYVCEGTYSESVKLTSAVSIHGGFACAVWSYSGRKAKVAPVDPGYALAITSVPSAVVVADLELLALAGTEAAPSSIAAFVSTSPNVTLRRVALTAQAAFKGKDGVAGATGTATPADLTGITATAGAGGAAKTCTCSSAGMSKGGKGGDPTGAVNGETGTLGQTSPDPLTATGAGQTGADCAGAGAPAKPGSNAPAAANAAAPATVATLDAMGLVPTTGANGFAGLPGQGGGGGGGVSGGNPGGGGGGACGGCGGTGGGGGSGGGASIALLLFSSPIKLEASTLTSANAGPGGSGAGGGSGQLGGSKGNGANDACPGGNGGRGGSGGAGAAGAGGISAGVVHTGGAPVLDATTQDAITTGTLGAKGLGGAPGVNDGRPGLADKVLAL